MSRFFAVLTTIVRKCLRICRDWYRAVRSEPAIHRTAEWWSRYYQRSVGSFILMLWMIMIAIVVFQELTTWSNAWPSRSYAFAVEINSVSWPELTCLPGIGEVLAKRIVDTRSRTGGFSRGEDLLVVRGIGPKTVARIGPYLRFTNNSDTGGNEVSNRKPANK